MMLKHNHLCQLPTDNTTQHIDATLLQRTQRHGYSRVIMCLDLFHKIGRKPELFFCAIVTTPPEGRINKIILMMHTV